MAGTLPPVPKTYKEALQSPFASQWQAAMDEEFDSLITNKTWRLTNLPPGRKAIRCKWVYALKTKPDGSLDRFKARLVAKGRSQIPGVDFHETFSPTVKYDSLRIILALVASLDLHMQQFDIKTTFLYGSIQEEIYMEQVEGYVDPTWIAVVCLLLQALYGLRQSSRAWSQKMEAFLKAFGLIQSAADHCVYYSHQGLPNTAQCNAIKRIGRYLKGTKHFKLVLGGLTGNGVLTAYMDVDYGADHLDRKSRTGYILFFNNGPVAWDRKSNLVWQPRLLMQSILLYIL